MYSRDLNQVQKTYFNLQPTLDERENTSGIIQWVDSYISHWINEVWKIKVVSSYTYLSWGDWHHCHTLSDSLNDPRVRETDTFCVHHSLCPTTYFSGFSL